MKFKAPHSWNPVFVLPLLTFWTMSPNTPLKSQIWLSSCQPIYATLLFDLWMNIQSGTWYVKLSPESQSMWRHFPLYFYNNFIIDFKRQKLSISVLEAMCCNVWGILYHKGDFKKSGSGHFAAGRFTALKMLTAMKPNQFFILMEIDDFHCFLQFDWRESQNKAFSQPLKC